MVREATSLFLLMPCVGAAFRLQSSERIVSFLPPFFAESDAMLQPSCVHSGCLSSPHAPLFVPHFLVPVAEPRQCRSRVPPCRARHSIAEALGRSERRLQAFHFLPSGAGVSRIARHASPVRRAARRRRWPRWPRWCCRLRWSGRLNGARYRWFMSVAAVGGRRRRGPGRGGGTNTERRPGRSRRHGRCQPLTLRRIVRSARGQRGSAAPGRAVM